MKGQRILNPVSQRPNKRLYSLKEASEYLGRGIWAIRRMIWNGEIAYVKAGQRRILLDIKDMNDWIEKNKTQFTY
jgi:excisionase family DNA binding protein